MFWVVILALLGVAAIAMKLFGGRTVADVPRQEPADVVSPQQPRSRALVQAQPVAQPSRPLVAPDELVYIEVTDWCHLDGECPAMMGEEVPVNVQLYKDVAMTHRVCPACKARRLRRA